MELGLGVLGWQPSEFWRASVVELSAAMAGYLEKNGLRQKRQASKQLVEDLKEMLDTIPDVMPSITSTE